MNDKTSTKHKPKRKLDTGVLIAIIALTSAVLGAFINGIFGNGVVLNRLFGPKTPTSSPTAIISDAYLELTAIAQETRRAQQRASAVAQFTQEAGATATQRYSDVLQTVQAQLEVTRIFEQAQQQVATEQAQNAAATAQSIIAVQQTATAIANTKRIDQLLGFADQVTGLPAALSDPFDDNQNGWSPKNYGDFSVSLKSGMLTVNLSKASISPLIWTCTKCGPFNDFSYQIDIKIPKDTPRVTAGIIFGSPTRLDQRSLLEYTMLLMHGTGDITLEKFSSAGKEMIGVWKPPQDLLTPDGKFHTLQIIGVDQYAAVYLDNKPVGDVFALEHSTQGYVGIVIQSPNVDIAFDNLKVTLMP